MFKRGQRLAEVRISDFAYGGKGIARFETEQGDYILFVESAIPGQLVSAQVTKSRKRHAEARLLHVLEHAQDEEPSRFQVMAGAPYITLPIDRQKELKFGATRDVYTRLGNIDFDGIFEEWIASPLTYGYRNKMEYSFGAIVHKPGTADEDYDGFGLGLKRRGTWWKVENLEKSSGLFDAAFEALLPDVRKLCEASGLPAWHSPRKEGFFRFLVVRKSFDADRFLITLVTSSQGLESFEPSPILELFKQRLGDRLAGFIHAVNDEVNDRGKIEAGKSDLLFGDNKIVESILRLSFEISMESFFQPNPLAAEKLYERVADYVYEGQRSYENTYVMDLFCGTGTIAQLIASRSPESQVIGVDIVKEAIANAEKNATRNALSNVEFFAEDAGKFLLNHPEYEQRIETVIVDPPRAGVGEKTIKKVLKLEARRIVYVSCNPATQTRDLNQLTEAGYTLRKLTLVDQFPHTAHIEAIALLDR